MAGPRGSNARLSIRLFVAGPGERTQRIIRRVESYLEERVTGADIEVVDVLADPAAAIDAGVIATPTLLAESSGRVRRAVGDMSDVAAVLKVLGVSERCA